MPLSFDSCEVLEEYLSKVLGPSYGRPDKRYATGWNFGGDASFVVNRRSREPRLFLPGGGELDLIYGLVRAIRAPGSKVSTLCNPYPGFRARGRIEVQLESTADLAAVGQYIRRLPGCVADLPPELRRLTTKSRNTPKFASESAVDEAALHAQLVVELKITSEDRHVVGQVIDYMTRISNEMSISPSDIQGLILCPRPTPHLSSMTTWVSGLKLMPIESLSLAS